MQNGGALAQGLFHIPLGIGNAYMVGTRRGWYLVDTGTAGNAEKIIEHAEQHFEDDPPEAILLTHGHFDHSGNAAELSDYWDAQVFAHRLELPFLTGKDKYPPPDPTVGGFMGFMIRMFPNKAYDLDDRVDAFPRNPLPGWEVLETPGHSPGHVSFFRREDRELIAGDAITTVKQCNMVSMLTQESHVWLPPEYYTCDWQKARASVEKIASLQPDVIAAGHGRPMQGQEALRELEELAATWPAPHNGRYTEEPAVTNEDGIVELPPKPFDPVATGFYGTAAILGAAGVLAVLNKRRAA
jgi:glyoxylase-like metal-dependent hydrolase (beta-lactamase superfamily II)